MIDNKEFKSNVARWALYRPDVAKLVEEVSDGSVAFCKAESGVDNLCKTVDGNQFFYHSHLDPIAEAESWFSERPFNQVQTLFIYGIGLGYYYEAAKKWLKANQQRSLVFIEDDPRVIKRFFETERAKEFLHDRQVFLDYISFEEELLDPIETLTLIYSFLKSEVSALRSYSQKKEYFKLKPLIEFFSLSAKQVTSEYISGGFLFYRNFFSNLLNLPGSFRAEGMFGAFKDVPAIICGAGPSLLKNVDLIGSLKNQALIFAGGTALNALNAHGIDPHFGLGVDPNATQATRLVNNHAYTTPFFFRTRMNHEALSLVPGDKIFVAKNGGHRISEWFEEKLGISGTDVLEGHNVLHLSLSLARLLGCNPILVAGADLAYSQGESYASGIRNHPIHDIKRDFRTKNIDDELLQREDIYGQPVQTTWKWVVESLWYYRIAHKNPNLKIVNVTEGGIGFPNVPNMTLQEAVDAFFSPTTDMSARVLGAILNSPMPDSVNSESLVDLAEEFMKSLQRCMVYCGNIETIIGKLCDQMMPKDEIFPSPDKNLIEEWKKEETALYEEEAYINDLNEFNSSYIRSRAIDLQRLLFDKGVKPEEEIRLKKLMIDKERYLSLKEDAAFHMEIIKKCLDAYDQKQKDSKEWSEKEGISVSEALKKQYPIPQVNSDDLYSFDNGVLTIVDSEMGISFRETIEESKCKKSSLKYPSGALQLVSFYKEGLLHGPSIAYGENGKELVRSWFWQGQRQGKVWSYYKSGLLYALQHFLNGKLEGRQSYFYENGLPKTIIHYSQGLLNGEIILWYPSGRKARHLHFVLGKKQGQECFWDEQGVLRIEAHYRDGMPVGTAKKWYDNGQLEKEIEYDDTSSFIEDRQWDHRGHPITTENAKPNDYFDDVTDQMFKLTDSLDNVYHQMTQIVPLINPASSNLKTPETPSSIPPAILSDLEELKQEMEHLQSLTEDLRVESQGQGRHSEALWKTPSAKHKLEKQIEALNEAVNKGLLDIQGGFIDLFKKMQEKNPDDFKKQ